MVVLHFLQALQKRNLPIKPRKTNAHKVNLKKGWEGKNSTKNKQIINDIIKLSKLQLKKKLFKGFLFHFYIFKFAIRITDVLLNQ